MDEFEQILKSAMKKAFAQMNEEQQQRRRTTDLFNERIKNDLEIFRPLSDIEDHNKQTTRKFITAMLNNRDILEVTGGNDGISSLEAKTFIKDSLSGLQRFTEGEYEKGFSLFDFTDDQATVILSSYILVSLYGEPLYETLKQDEVVSLSVCEAYTRAFIELKEEHLRKQGGPLVIAAPFPPAPQ